MWGMSDPLNHFNKLIKPSFFIMTTVEKDLAEDGHARATFILPSTIGV
jgi:hypothetical protein